MNLSQLSGEEAKTLVALTDGINSQINHLKPDEKHFAYLLPPKIVDGHTPLSRFTEKVEFNIKGLYEPAGWSITRRRDILDEEDYLEFVKKY